MPRRALLAVAVSVTLAAGCSSNTAPGDARDTPSPDAGTLDTMPDTLRIPVGRERTADGGRLAVRFVAKLSESRCPANAMCVWQGDASIRLRVTVAGTAVDTVLHTGIEPRSIAIDRYVLTLPGLFPYPGTWPEGTPEPAATAWVAVGRR